MLVRPQTAKFLTTYMHIDKLTRPKKTFCTHGNYILFETICIQPTQCVVEFCYVVCRIVLKHYFKTKTANWSRNSTEGISFYWPHPHSPCADRSTRHRRSPSRSPPASSSVAESGARGIARLCCSTLHPTWLANPPRTLDTIYGTTKRHVTMCIRTRVDHVFSH